LISFGKQTQASIREPNSDAAYVARNARKNITIVVILMNYWLAYAIIRATSLEIRVL
jgi:hypothetical protein